MRVVLYCFRFVRYYFYYDGVYCCEAGVYVLFCNGA